MEHLASLRCKRTKTTERSVTPFCNSSTSELFPPFPRGAGRASHTKTVNRRCKVGDQRPCRSTPALPRASSRFPRLLATTLPSHHHPAADAAGDVRRERRHRQEDQHREDGHSSGHTLPRLRRRSDRVLHVLLRVPLADEHV